MTLDNRGRKPGMKKVGGAKRGSIHTNSNEVKSAVLRVFNEVNKDDTYLKTLAVEDQRLFLSLLTKLLPSAVDVAVNHHVFDLGSAMLAASSRVEELANQPSPKVIDATPQPLAEPETRQHVYQPLTIFDEVKPEEPSPQPDPDIWEGY